MTNLYKDWLDAMGWTVREFELAHRDKRLLPCPHANMAEHLVMCPAHPDNDAMCSTCMVNHVAECERLCAKCGGARATEYWDAPAMDDITITCGADEFVWPVTVLWVPLCEGCADFGEAVQIRKGKLLARLAVELITSPHEATSTEFAVGAHISGRYPMLGIHMTEDAVNMHVSDDADAARLTSCDCCQRRGTVGGWSRDGFLIWHDEQPLVMRFGPGVPVIYRGLLNVHGLARICDDCRFFWLEAEYPSMDVRREPVDAA